MLRFPYIFSLERHGYITDASISMGPIVKRGARRVPATFVGYIVPIYRRLLNKRMIMIIMDKNTKKQKKKKKKKHKKE